MMPRKTLVFVMGVLSTAWGKPAPAQDAVIRGMVRSADRNEPIPGATVLIADLNLSALTTERGTYLLSIPPARIPSRPITLTARAIGFKSVGRTLSLHSGDLTADFVLETDVNRLEEIIVTGTLEGVERAKVPFAVGRLTREDLPVPAADPLRAIQGKLAGVRIAQTNGRPGFAPEVLLRGPTSINAVGRSQQPLVFVDGVIASHVGNLQELGGLDIESVEVVNGAAGTSLYGTQAANGVITITTRRGGTQEGVRFTTRTDWGFSDLNSIDYQMPVNHPLQLDETGKRFCVIVSSGSQSCARSVDYMTEMLRINNVNADTIRKSQAIWYNNPNQSDLRNIFQSQIYPGRYWNLLAILTARRPATLTSIDATGKAGGVGFYLSGQYTRDPGAIRMLQGSDQRRVRLNLDFSPRADLRLSASAMYDNFYRDNRTDGSSNTFDDQPLGVFAKLMQGAMPGFNYLARDTLGRLLTGRSPGWRPTTNSAGNPLYDFDNYLNYRTANRFLGSLSAKYLPASWVTFEGVFGYDNRASVFNEIIKKGYRTISINTALNNGQQTSLSDRDEQINTMVSATFRHQLARELKGKLRFAANYDQQKFVSLGAYGENYVVKDIYQLSNTSTNFSAFSSGRTLMNAGYSSAMTLDYKDRYIVDGSYRWDGSSLFGPGHRWAPFSRIAGVWIVSREPFWQHGWMKELRFRFSRGTAGATPNANAQYEILRVSTTGISTAQAGNAALGPETTTEYEFGTDFTLFGRLGFEVTHAMGTTRDQILPVPTPASTGFQTQWQNAGTVQNRTWEVGLTIPVVNSKTLYWQAKATWDRNRTYLTELFTPNFIADRVPNSSFASSWYFTTDTRRVCLPGQEGHLPGEPGYGPGESRPFCTGPRLNRVGNFSGRWFLRGCGELAAALRDRCGEGKDFQVNDEGWLVWVGAGNSWRDGITRNLWQTTLPSDESPWGVPLSWGHPIVDRPLAGQPGEGVGIQNPYFNSLPDFRFSLSSDFSYRRLTLNALLDGTIGQDLEDQSQVWGLLDFGWGKFDQAGKTVETAKPLGYTWRAGSPEATGTGGFYDLLVTNNHKVQSGSFVKLRELSATYRLGAIGGVGNWTVGLVGRNVHTFTRYTGLDPETSLAGGTANSGLINSGDYFQFPTLRTWTLTVSTRF